jgi:hypothetical protein
MNAVLSECTMIYWILSIIVSTKDHQAISYVQNISPLAVANTPSGCAIFWLAVGEMHIGMLIGWPRIVVDKSTSEIPRSIRGLNLILFDESNTINSIGIGLHREVWGGHQYAGWKLLATASVHCMHLIIEFVASPTYRKFTRAIRNFEHGVRAAGRIQEFSKGGPVQTDLFIV